MPYTPAHAIFVAPIWYTTRKRLSLAPLIVGSLSPDLPYVVYLSTGDSPGHYPLGLFTHAVPHGLLLLALWYLWLEKPISTLLSLPLPHHKWSWSLSLEHLLSLYIGAVTHALIDATSHEPGWFVQRFSIFNTLLFQLPLYKWIQYGSGVGGLCLMGLWYWQCRRAEYKTSVRLRAIAVSIILPCTLGFMGLANWIHQTHTLKTIAVTSAASLMTGVLVGACLYALWFYRHEIHRSL